MRRELKEMSLVFFILLTSSTTLLCCTLPILFVLLGLGASFASLTLQFSWWGTLAEYKFWLFLFSGILIILSYFFLKYSNKTCPIDPVLRQQCLKIRSWNKVIYIISVIIWIIGFVSAYLALPIKEWLS